MNWRQHIDVRGSEPRLTRVDVRVETILSILGTGASIESVLSKVPGLTREDVAACIGFAADTIQRTRFVDSIRRGLEDTTAGRLTDDDEFWKELERDATEK